MNLGALMKATSLITLAKQCDDSTEPALQSIKVCEPELESWLESLMSRYVVTPFDKENRNRIQRAVQGMIDTIDYSGEGYSDDELSVQRDLSIKFTWGHDHDFGDFQTEGRMGRRHITLLQNFMTVFPAVDRDFFHGKKVLDIGCWTGGTTLMLAALGAEVTAIEEVHKYALATEYLLKTFGISGDVRQQSLYDLDDVECFDVVYFPGVIYHLSDPLLACRLLYNSLRVGGTILVETACINVRGSFCRYEGSQEFHSGSQANLDRGGWNWFCPSPLALGRMLYGAGFDDIQLAIVDDRLFAYARKVKRVGITRAGLSRPRVR